jgi:hypothetical protein
MASIPHLGYGYPLHIDEWWHYGDASSLLAAKDTSFPNVFDSGIAIGTDKELGFHLVLAALKATTGASWLTLFRWLPGIIIV